MRWTICVSLAAIVVLVSCARRREPVAVLHALAPEHAVAREPLIPRACERGTRRWQPARGFTAEELTEDGFVSRPLLGAYPELETCSTLGAVLVKPTLLGERYAFESFCARAGDGRLACLCAGDATASPDAEEAYVQLWPGGGHAPTHLVAVDASAWHRSGDDDLARLRFSVMDADLDADGTHELVISLLESNDLAYATDESTYQTFILADATLLSAQERAPVSWRGERAQLPYLSSTYELTAAVHEHLDGADPRLAFHGTQAGGCALVKVEHGFLIDTASGSFYRRETAHAYRDHRVEAAGPTWSLYRVDPDEITAFGKTRDRDALTRASRTSTLRRPGEPQP